MKLSLHNETLHDDRGFALAELLAAIAITGILLAGLVFGVGQIVRTSQADQARVLAVRNVETAAYWLVRDLQCAQSYPASVTLGPGSNSLNVVQSLSNPSDTSVAYSISASNSLRRTVGGATSTVAQYITDVAYSSGSPNTVQITATVGSTTIIRSLNVVTRIR